MGDFYGAISDYNKALRLNPDSDWMFYKLSLSKYKLEDYDNSIKDINKAIKLDEDYGDYYLFKSQINRDLENFSDAIENITIGISKLDPNDSVSYGNLFSTRAEIKYFDLEDPYSAISDYNEAIKYDPISSNYVGRANVKLLDVDDYEGALLDLNKGIELYNDDVDDEHKAYLFYSRAYAKGELEDYYGAIGDISEAIELDNKKSSYYEDRGNYKMNLDDYKRAIPDINKALELNSSKEEIPRLKLLLAACINWSGDPKRALEILNESKRLFYDSNSTDQKKHLPFLFLFAKASINIGLNSSDELEEGLGLDTNAGCDNLKEAQNISGIDEEDIREVRRMIIKYCN
jgi:tetratricopeptide (TPR) repeat protein